MDLHKTIIDGLTVEHYGDVPLGLAYLEEGSIEAKEAFENSRLDPDHKSHFEFYSSKMGKTLRYTLTHTDYDKYFLKPRI